MTWGKLTERVSTAFHSIPRVVSSQERTASHCMFTLSQRIRLAPPVMTNASTQPKHRKLRGQTLVHILALLYFAFKLNRKINQKVDELGRLKHKP